jgi:hypothetical protein
MSRRNHPTVSPAGDPRSTEEILASVRRKLFFVVLAVCAPVIAFAMSSAADKSRRAAFEACLPPGITLEKPLGPGAAATVFDRLAEIGAEIRDGKLFDAQGKPVVFRVVREGQEASPEGQEKLESLSKTSAVIQVEDASLPPGYFPEST